MKKKSFLVSSVLLLSIVLFSQAIIGCAGEKNNKAANSDLPIEAIKAYATASQNFIIKDGQYSSSIFVGVEKTTLDPTIYLTYDYPFYESYQEDGETRYELSENADYEEVPLGENGKGLYTVDCKSTGAFEYGGLIHYELESGDLWLPFESQYTVGMSGYTVDLSKSNVIYRGLENPINFSVSGYPREFVKLEVSDGAEIKDLENGKKAILVSPEKDVENVEVFLSVGSGDGLKELGTVEFKVLNVPNPKIQIGSKFDDGAHISKIELKKEPYLSAKLESDFFPYEGVSFSVTSFDLYYVINGVTNIITSDNSSFSDKIIEEIDKINPNYS